MRLLRFFKTSFALTFLFLILSSFSINTISENENIENGKPLDKRIVGTWYSTELSGDWFTQKQIPENKIRWKMEVDDKGMKISAKITFDGVKIEYQDYRNYKYKDGEFYRYNLQGIKEIYSYKIQSKSRITFKMSLDEKATRENDEDISIIEEKVAKPKQEPVKSIKKEEIKKPEAKKVDKKMEAKLEAKKEELKKGTSKEADTKKNKVKKTDAKKIEPKKEEIKEEVKEEEAKKEEEKNTAPEVKKVEPKKKGVEKDDYNFD